MSVSNGKEPQAKVVREGPLTLHLAADRMLAQLELAQDRGVDPVLLNERLHVLLRGQGVVHGINQEAIDTILSGPGTSGAEDIARGTPARNGFPVLHHHFATARLTMPAEEGGEAATVETIELLRPASPIVSLRLSAPVREGKDIQGRPVQPDGGIILIAGPNTSLALDSLSITATASGYPKVSKQQGQGGEHVMIELTPVVRLEQDGMSAYMTLLPLPPEHTVPDPAILLEMLREAGVVFGIDTEALSRLHQQRSTSPTGPVDMLVARGRLPRHGQDAFLRFEVEIGPLPGKLLEDGSMDFRERRMFVGVRAGELLASKGRATMGEPGCDVLGRPAPARAGRDLVVKVSDDAGFDEASGEIRALKAGVLSLVQGSSLKVCAMQVISGDVDFSTGNIDSRDSVAVGGSVLNGFVVKAGGDVEVKGSLHGGTILCGGNVLLQGGMNGDSSLVEAGGDLDLKFIERGLARAGGSIILRKSCYYGRLYADGDIICEPSSRILGGELVASGKVVTGQAGSATAEPGLLAAAVDPRRFLQLGELHGQLREKEEAWMHLQQRLGHDPQSPGALRLVKEMNRLRNRLDALSLVPAALLDERGQPHLPHQLGIDVHGTVFAGTVLRIGDVTLTLDADTSRKRFRLDVERATIVASSL